MFAISYPIWIISEPWFYSPKHTLLVKSNPSELIKTDFFFWCLNRRVCAAGVISDQAHTIHFECSRRSWSLQSMHCWCVLFASPSPADAAAKCTSPYNQGALLGWFNYWHAWLLLTVDNKPSGSFVVTLRTYTYTREGGFNFKGADKFWRLRSRCMRFNYKF